MKIAGVSVNEKSLPTETELIILALNTRKYYQFPKDKAVKLIKKEIKESGLFKADTGKIKKPTSKSSGNSRKRSNNK